MTRTDRQYDSPAYPVAEVVALARKSFVLVEPKAEHEYVEFMGEEIVSVHSEIVEVLCSLHRQEWQFAQIKDGEWADIYRVEFTEGPDAWIKVKIERPKGYEAVAVISFHEWRA